MTKLELLSAAASIATVVAAFGVVYASKQALVALRQLAHSKDSQAVALHSGFQREFREWQKLMPPEVFHRDWEPTTDAERRLVQLYWELVFDEWYTCTQVSEEPRVRALWDAYAHGVASALKRKAFVESIAANFRAKTAFLGLESEFKDEMVRCFQKANKGKSVPFAVDA